MAVKQYRKTKYKKRNINKTKKRIDGQFEIKTRQTIENQLMNLVDNGGKKSYKNLKSFKKAIEPLKNVILHKEFLLREQTKERLNKDEKKFPQIIANHLWRWIDDDEEFAYAKLLTIDDNPVDIEMQRKFEKKFLYSQQIREGDCFQIIMKNFSENIICDFKRKPRLDTKLFDEEINLLSQNFNDKKSR